MGREGGGGLTVGAERREEKKKDEEEAAERARQGEGKKRDGCGVLVGPGYRQDCSDETF